MHNISPIAFIGSLGGPELIMILILLLLGGVFGVLPFWFICKKAGFSPWLSLIILAPFGAIILPFILAFSEWKTTS